MKYQINKYRMADDIVLTIALIVSVILVKGIMYLVGVETEEYDGIIFLSSCFVSIKLIYNVLTRMVKNMLNKGRLF